MKKSYKRSILALPAVLVLQSLIFSSLSMAYEGHVYLKVTGTNSLSSTFRAVAALDTAILKPLHNSSVFTCTIEASLFTCKNNEGMTYTSSAADIDSKYIVGAVSEPDAKSCPSCDNANQLCDYLFPYGTAKVRPKGNYCMKQASGTYVKYLGPVQKAN